MHGKHIFRARLANQVFEATSPLQRRAGPCNLSQQLSPTSVLSLRHRAEGPGQNSKQAIVAEENKHSSVSLTFEGSAFHASDIDHTVIATYQSRYPIARAAAENEELNKCDVAVSAGLCTRETRAGEECAAPQHTQVIIPSPNSLSTPSNTKDFTKPHFTYRNINTNGTYIDGARSPDNDYILQRQRSRKCFPKYSFPQL